MYLVSRTETFAKLFFIISVSGLFMYIFLAFYTFHIAFKSGTQLQISQNRIQGLPIPDADTKIIYNDNIKYILLWTVGNITIVNGFGEGQSPFILNNCSKANCYLTTNKNFIGGDYTKFDAVIIELPITRAWYARKMPHRRSRKQKFIFRGMLSSRDIPVCNVNADRFFNWTWSYKLYSDIFVPFIQVKDLNGNYVAPSIDVEWISVGTKHENISMETSRFLGLKSKAVAWIMNTCETRHNRMKFVKGLAYFLRSFKLYLDIYGCDHLKCPEEGCLNAVKRDYYFYLVYENSLADDYTTTEILKAYDNYAVPIVISGADLSRFLPAGSYIDAGDMIPDRIATIVDYMISNPSTFTAFHLWRNHYTVQQFPENQEICKLCDAVNNDEMVKTESVYEYFRKWWFQGTLKEACGPKSYDKFKEVLAYRNESRRTRTKKVLNIE